MIRYSKAGAVAWARQMLNGAFFVLDTETTGIGDAEICQLSLIDQDGRAHINTLVKPRCSIPPDATAIHGITNAMVADAPTWENVAAELASRVAGGQVVIYNADYDLRVIRSSYRWAGIEPQALRCDVHCAMKHYAAFWGERRGYSGDYTWQKLTAACWQQRIVVDAPAHSALGDCLRTLALVCKMAESSLSPLRSTSPQP